MSKNLKILACCHRLDYSGAPLLLFRLMKALASRHDITILGPDVSDEETVLEKDYAALGIPVVKSAYLSKFDLLVGNTLLSNSHVVNAAGKVPTVFWVHEPADGLSGIKRGRIDPTAFKLADQVVFPTAWQANTLYGPYVQGREVEIVPYGIEPRAVPRSKPYSLPEGTHALLQLGWLASRKGQDLTVAALERLEDPSIHVFLAGADSVRPKFAERLKAKVEGSPLLAQQVHFLGPLAPDVVDAYLAHVDALLFPTNDDLISVSILEAMARKTCVISSDFGPIPETVIDGETGLLFPVRGVDAYAECIRRVVADPDLKERLALGGYEIYRRKHSFEDHVAAMEQVFLKAASA
ncbi:glycosyltransferase family 4 protein [Nisaea acidiphila]|uniref:Glycosyltransferase family 4 protein n=1 Tax=Nisaea acidiphila TaxID=1862145 RepID=A0A9J7AN77_9PROT|nr:glycosyltransferase family 4 protein [Nisaea acidiphila]UUX48402.1 glycosyltransferase family 4 protein [Nisaea acidiphila]